MQKQKSLVISLVGPTASGKTALGIEIAEELNLTIHNVDSRQLYVGMDIGTAKPSKEQQNRVFHHLIDFRQPNQPITLQEFKQKAESSIKDTLRTRGIALLVGGSGLYMKCLTKGYQPPAVPPQHNLRKQLSSLGQEIAYQLLQQSDPLAATKISGNKSGRANS